MKIRKTFAPFVVTLVAALAFGGQAQANLAGHAASLVPPDIPATDIMPHLQRFQTIADQGGGTRAHGSPGYRASADYVKSTLDAAGFETTMQSFTYNGRTGWNVIADWPSGNANEIVFLGAHLDSVTAGPGINDNASGSAAALATALAVAKANPQLDKRLRFGWWGAEELGLIGSRYYVNSLPSAERAKIDAYLNFDMVGARNTTTWGVYNDNASLQQMFVEYFRSKGIGTRSMNIGGRSDHASFARVGIPVSGIASGSDPCYHRPCDDLDNVGSNVMTVSTNAAAHAAWTLSGATAQSMPRQAA